MHEQTCVEGGLDFDVEVRYLGRVLAGGYGVLDTKVSYMFTGKDSLNYLQMPIPFCSISSLSGGRSVQKGRDINVPSVSAIECCIVVSVQLIAIHRLHNTLLRTFFKLFDTIEYSPIIVLLSGPVVNIHSFPLSRHCTFGLAEMLYIERFSLVYILRPALPLFRPYTSLLLQ